MSEGFYVTNKGMELISAAVKEEKTVNITKAKYGSGGDNVSPWNFDITDLNHEEYSKNLDPITDSYRISEDDPKALIIETVVPAEVTCTINEIGYFDENDNLIIYGIPRERVKEGDVPYRYKNWVKFDNEDPANVQIFVKSPDYERVEKLVEEYKAEIETKFTENQNTLTQLLEQAESDFDLASYVTHQEFETLQGALTGFEAALDEVLV